MAEAAWINADAGAPAYNAQELRRIQSMFLFPGSSHRFGAREGVRPTGQSIVDVSGTTWIQRDLTAVTYPGLTSISGPYVAEKAEEQGSFDPADGTNDRIDALDLLVQDDDEDASGNRELTVVYVAGTPAGSPSEPPLTPNAFRIGTFDVPAGGSPSPSVRTEGHLTVATGGVLPVRDGTEGPTTGRYEGMYRDRGDTDQLERWDGAAWQAMASEEIALRGTLFCRSEKSSAQSISPNTPTALLFNVDVYDPYGIHSTVSDTSRFQPTRPGWYQFSGGFAINIGTDELCNCSWNKNGGALDGSQGARVEGFATAGEERLVLRPISVLMNGTTDYIEVSVNHDGAVARDIGTGSSSRASVDVIYLGPDLS